MKFFFAPGNNSISHVIKCLSIMDILLSHGHEVYIAVGRKYSNFLKTMGYYHFILPNIQELDDSGFPSFKWFSNSKYIQHCISAEINLLQKLNPDRVLGVFNFTFQISSLIAGIPYDSLVCGCMLKESGDILGFHGDEPDAKHQEINMGTFFYYATEKMNRAMKSIYPCEITDIRDLLKGRMTFLWDFPEFMPLPELNSDIVHVGPISYQKRNTLMNDSHIEDDVLCPDSEMPLAVISFGTCSGDLGVLEKLTKICLDAGSRIFIAAGGQKEYLDIFKGNPRVFASLFPDLSYVFKKAGFLITHGGQLTVFEALKEEIPVMVVPFQPEQAHNGICLERIGCGKLLIPPIPFRGDTKVYINAFNDMKDMEIADMIYKLCNDSQITQNLFNVRARLNKYEGAGKLVSIFEKV